ncbi:hypothetical protein [Arthrobacter sp.]|uniref:hypothetical protein n=1 Tax=Arthrobacter sp. TaxID=1667 RepID=UPI003A93ACD8
MSTHERRRHAKQPDDPATRKHEPAVVEAPVVLPLLVVTVTETGALDVTLDGTDFPAPEDADAWTRRSFGRLLDAATREREVSLRVEVRETDGTSFTDLIPARPRRTPLPAPEPAPETKPAGRGLVEVTAGGFVAGEDVDACLVIAHTDATHAGTARVVIDPATVPEQGGMVLLVGRVSGHVHAEGLS